jgi:large subunit ribosomal protein L29
MNATDLRKKNNEELNNMLLELRREQFNLRMQKGTGQLSKPSEVKRVRRAIARIKTIMNELSTGKKS